MSPRIAAGADRPAIFISGAASGIGRASAQLFAKHGWFVGIYDIDEAPAASLAASLGEGAAAYGVLDVRDSAGWSAALADFWSKSGQRLDVLLNNAGILTSGRFATTPLDRHVAMLDVNVRGVVAGCHHAYPYLVQTPGSRVINMASATAIYGQPELATYSATKFAVRGLTEALDLEWAADGIRVRDVWPSFVRTAMAQGFGEVKSAKSLGVRLTPEDVAAVIWKCANAKGAAKTHWTVGIQAALLSLGARQAPQALTRRLVKRMAK